MATKLTVLIRVRYAECDAQSVVFNARYGEYVDLAVTEIYRVLFGSYEQLLTAGFDSQVVSAKTDWVSPARFDEVIAITLESVKLGNTSYTFEFTMSEFYSERLIATALITYVAVTPDSLQKQAIPAAIREKLSNPPGKLINLAGVAL